MIDVNIYTNTQDPTKNRGFAFVEYRDHRTAAMARRKLAPGKVLLFNHQVAVDWAEPEETLDDDIMAKVKILYVRYISTATTEDFLWKTFSIYGTLERVKKLRDYAFIHFLNRPDAIKAMENLSGFSCDGSNWEITLAKPVGDKHNNTKMVQVGAKALAAAQAGVDPEAFQAAQTASFLMQGGPSDIIPDVIQSNAEHIDWGYLSKIYPTKSGKGRAAMRSCYLGYR